VKYSFNAIVIDKRYFLKAYYSSTALSDEKGCHMIEAKDFATGCLTLIVCAALIPLFLLVFKLTLLFAVLLAIPISIVLGITILGRVVRYFITGK